MKFHRRLLVSKVGFSFFGNQKMMQEAMLTLWRIAVSMLRVYQFVRDRHGPQLGEGSRSRFRKIAPVPTGLLELERPKHRR